MDEARVGEQKLKCLSRAYLDVTALGDHGNRVYALVVILSCQLHFIFCLRCLVNPLLSIAKSLCTWTVREAYFKQHPNCGFGV